MANLTNEYQIDYKISRNAKITLVVLFMIFLTGVVIKFVSLWMRPSYLDVIFLLLFMMFFSFSWAAVWAFLIKNRPVVAISSKNLLVAVPYFFKIKSLRLSDIKEVKISVWSRSEIVVQDGVDLRGYSFMSPFLSKDDRESFLSNIFDLLPNTTVK